MGLRQGLAISLLFVTWLGASAARAQSRSPKHGAAAKTLMPTVNVEPASVVSVPYGYAYFTDATGHTQSMRAYPTLPSDMHAFDTAPPSELATERWLREGWRVLVRNDTKRRLWLTNTRLSLDSFAPLPARYVCVWLTKGQETQVAVAVKLHAADRSWPLLPDQGQPRPLEPGESFVFNIRVASAEPGIYKMSVKLDVHGEGEVADRALLGKELDLFVPDRLAAHGINLRVAGSRLEALAARFLRLNQQHFDEVAGETVSASWKLDRAPEQDVAAAALEADDERFLKTVRRWRDLSMTETDPVGTMAAKIAGRPTQGREIGTGYALELATNPSTLSQAINVLNEYELREPEDDMAALQLMRYLTDARRIDDAGKLWSRLATSRLYDTRGYYRAGIVLAEATKNDSLEAGLLAQSKRDYPEDLWFLAGRVDRLNAKSLAAAEEIRQVCAYSDVFDERDMNTLARLVWTATNTIADLPLSGRATAVRSLFARCPSQAMWLARTNPALWRIAPELRLVPDVTSDARVPRDEWLIAAAALARSGRLRAARAALGSVLRIDPTPKAWSLAAAFAFRAGAPGDALDAARKGLAVARPADEEAERLLGIALLATCKLHDFSAFVDLHDRFAQLGAPLVLHQRAAAPPRARNLLRLVDDIATGERAFAGHDVVAWMESDPGPLIGGYGPVSSAAVHAVVEAVAQPADGRGTRGLGRVPSALLAVLDISYLPPMSEVMPNPYRTVAEESALGVTSIWKFADDLKVAAVGLEPSKGGPIFVRTRERLDLGVQAGDAVKIYLGHNESQSLEDWQQSHRKETDGAKGGVYLVPMAGERFQAELDLRSAEVAALGDYDIARGSGLAAKVLSADPLNVEAWFFAASLAASTGDVRVCLSRVASGLDLDPKYEPLLALKIACTEGLRGSG